MDFRSRINKLINANVLLNRLLGGMHCIDLQFNFKKKKTRMCHNDTTRKSFICLEESLFNNTAISVVLSPFHLPGSLAAPKGHCDEGAAASVFFLFFLFFCAKKDQSLRSNEGGKGTDYILCKTQATEPGFTQQETHSLTSLLTGTYFWEVKS